MQLFTTGEAEALLPVFTTILSFSPDEVKRCRAGLELIKKGEVPLPGAADMVDTTLSGAASVLHSLTGWTTWALGSTGGPEEGGGGGGAGVVATPAAKGTAS